MEENISLNYLKYFIEKGIINNYISIKSPYFKKIIMTCNSMKNSLEKIEINFSVVKQLKELIQKQKLNKRVYYICLGDKKESEELAEKIRIYTEKYIIYNSQLEILITYYNKYYPNFKKVDIDNFSKQQSNFKEAKINVCKIQLNEYIYDEIKIFDKYEKSKFFGIFYNIENKNEDQISNIDIKILQIQEEEKFKKTIEKFNKCEQLFIGQDFELEFLDIPLTLLEDNDSNENLLEEIIYLKNIFGHSNANEKAIAENLILYKNRKIISFALKSLINLCKKLSVERIEKKETEIDNLAERLFKLKKFSETRNLIEEIKGIDENFFEKNFVEILIKFYKNDKLILFLNAQKESETRDLIDGLFDEDEDENYIVELKDIEILINVVCFFQDIKSKTKNLNMFLDNFHSILNNKNNLYLEIISNIVHINIKLESLQEFIRIQLGKKFKFSTNLEQFMTQGIIRFEKVPKRSIFLYPDDYEYLPVNRRKMYLLFSELQDENQDINFFFNAYIKINEKEQNLETFMENIKRIKSKNIYKYGKNKENVLKAKKIALLIQAILDELNFDITQEFNEVYKVWEFKFEDTGILKLKKLEEVLEKLKKKNYQTKNGKLKALDINPNLQFLFNLDSLDKKELENRYKIESFFPSIREMEDDLKNKIVHKNIECDGCGMHPLIGIRYKCKTCPDFDYCENCYENKPHSHEFNKIEVPVDYESSLDLLIMLQLNNTQIKEEYGNLKGFFFYKSSKSNYEIDILKFYNKLLKENRKTNTDSSEDLKINLPNFINLLLCYDDDLTDMKIYAFCVRAINCESNSLFIIVRPEELKISQEKFLFDTLNKKLEKKGNKINSCIIILYINQNSHIIKQLKNLKEKCEFPEEPQLFESLENSPLQDLSSLPVEIVTSDSPRVGKTHYIFSKIGINNYYQFIPLGNVDQLFLETKAIRLQNSGEDNLSVIFELYENPNENTYNLIKNFLFQILILRIYREFNYIGRKKFRIFIEVSSDYTTFYEDFKFLRPFKRYHIEFKNHPDFYEKNIIIPKEDNQILNELFQGKILNSNNLIKEYFMKEFPSKDLLPNFGQIEMFFSILDYLIDNFKKFENINSENLKEDENKNKFDLWEKIKEKITKKIILSYIKFVIKFTALSYESILENQEEAAKHQKTLIYKIDEEKKKKLIKEINKKRVVSYNDMKPALILFNNIPEENGYKEINICSILIGEKDPEYDELNEFYEKYLGNTVLYNLFEFGGSDFIFELKNICVTPDSLKITINEELRKQGYEFTIDNFVKMVLIYIRIKADVPLILMGETGCGKTSLIESLYLFISDRYELIKFDIHSGLSYTDITNFFEEKDLFEKDEKKEKEKKTILFLDEINTTNCINLLCDVFVKHSYLGRKIKSSVFIIAACNPYRLMLSDTKEIGYINKKMHRIRNLVYTVNPLPLSLINYVFDFGNVKDEDEKKYIRKFIDTFLNEKFSVDDQVNYAKILSIIVSAVYEAQKFIRNNSEISSVSLREIKRFKIFFEFFFNITKRREGFKDEDLIKFWGNSKFSKNKKDSIKSKKKQISEEDKELLIAKQRKKNLLCLKAANLGLFMCFYIRIIDPSKKKELVNILEKILNFDFLEYPLKLENELADSLDLGKGIAKNRALLDNLFTLFVCLNNKIPVFICGKAGCSKTLSFSLLFEGMKGEYSKSELFKKYPGLYVTSYQGSLTSSSSEIKTIFKRAKKVISKQKDTKKNLSVILFDEMGLAEISPLNPLKVIHSELDGKQEVAFVGISNF